MKFPLCLLVAAMLMCCAGSASAAKPKKEKQKLLTISATVDGSEKIRFTEKGVKWKHLNWSIMSNVMFNGSRWEDLTKTPEDWVAFCDGLDLTKARIVKRKGRDVIALETTKKGFVLYLDDSPNGAADYSVTIAIPYRK